MRLIDIDDFEEKMSYSISDLNYHIEQYMKKSKPIDAVKVVRCKDCKYRDGTPGQPNILCYNMHDDDFCSYGELK